MLKVDQYGYVRTAHRVYGKKIKQIARETGHSKNTVKKVLREEYSGYKPRISQPYPVLGPYLNIIDRWLMGATVLKSYILNHTSDISQCYQKHKTPPL